MKRPYWFSPFVVLALVGAALAAEPRTIDLEAGKTVTYRYRQESDTTFSVSGRDQKEKNVATFHLTATVGPKSATGKIAVVLRVSRLVTSLEGFADRNFALDTKTFDSGETLPTHKFVPAMAMMRSPVQLVYRDDGALTTVDGASRLQAKIEDLLKEDFLGTEEAELVRQTFVDNAGETAMRAMWKDALIVGLPKDFQFDRPWQESTGRDLIVVLPSESWVAPIECSIKSTIEATDLGDGALRIDCQSQVPAGTEKTVTLGPVNLDYTVQDGTGTDLTTVDADGWVRQAEGQLSVNLSGKIDLNDKMIPLRINLTTKYHIERVDP